MEGIRTTVELKTKPIIQYIVCFQNFFIQSLITFKKNNPPIASPNPIGIKTVKFKEETDSKYQLYTPRHIRITVLLTPGKTTPIAIKKPQMKR